VKIFIAFMFATAAGVVAVIVVIASRRKAGLAPLVWYEAPLPAAGFAARIPCPAGNGEQNDTHDPSAQTDFHSPSMRRAGQGDKERGGKPS